VESHLPTFNDYAGLSNHHNADGNGRILDGHSMRSLLENPEKGAWDSPPVALSSVRNYGRNC
jgi:hypothetical protein